MFLTGTAGNVYVGVVASNPTSENSLTVTNTIPNLTYTGIIVGSSLETSSYTGTVDGTTYDVAVGVGTLETPAISEISNGDVAYLDGVTLGIVTAGEGTTTLTIAVDVTGAVAQITGTTVKFESTNGVSSTFYDANSDFIGNNVVPGDLINAETAANADIVGTITNIVNKNTVFFNAASTDVDDNDSNYYLYKTANTLDVTSTAYATEYSVTRLLGFSEFAGVGTGNTHGTTTDSKIVKIEGASIGDYEAGQLIAFDTVNTTTSFTSYQAVIANVVPFTESGPTVTGVQLTLDTEMSLVDGLFPYTWDTTKTTDVKATFRAVNSDGYLAPVRITSVNDIIENYGEISPYNELAFMLNTMYANSQFKVCYGMNVASDTGNIETEYGKGFEALSNLEVYSHAIGSTQVSATFVASYVNQASDPYEAHERIAVCSIDMDDMTETGNGGVSTFLQVDGDNDVLTTLNSDLNVIRVSIGDEFRLVNDDGDLGLYIAKSTPLTDSQVEVEWVSGEVFTNTSQPTTYEIHSGDSTDQANRFAESGIGERRVAIVFPGWFTAEYNGDIKEFPPYFISATIAGKDGGEIVSQSFTNMTMAVSGLKSYQLDTTSFYSKSDLDLIGSGGYDIMMQTAPITQTFMSRHDLTTNMDAIEYRERSITKQVDLVAKTYRAAISPYIGKYNISDKLVKFIKQICVNVNKSITKDSIVRVIETISVERDKDIADKINIIVSVTVFVAGNYYEITLNVKS